MFSVCIHIVIGAAATDLASLLKSRCRYVFLYQRACLVYQGLVKERIGDLEPGRAGLRQLKVQWQHLPMVCAVTCSNAVTTHLLPTLPVSTLLKQRVTRLNNGESAFASQPARTPSRGRTCRPVVSRVGT
jgi:hypothetical protein